MNNYASAMWVHHHLGSLAAKLDELAEFGIGSVIEHIEVVKGTIKVSIALETITPVKVAGQEDDSDS